jgi:hypothetical protein
MAGLMSDHAPNALSKPEIAMIKALMVVAILWVLVCTIDYWELGFTDSEMETADGLEQGRLKELGL